MINTNVKIDENEVYKIIRKHFSEVHKLDIDNFGLKLYTGGDFSGFNLKITEIETNVEEIHENTPNFVPEGKKVMI